MLNSLGSSTVNVVHSGLSAQCGGFNIQEYVVSLPQDKYVPGIESTQTHASTQTHVHISMTQVGRLRMERVLGYWHAPLLSVLPLTTWHPSVLKDYGIMLNSACKVRRPG